MKTKSNNGKRGENLAESFLIGLGYHILAKNWRYKRAEIDIICKKKEILIFVEVKTRLYNHYGEPESFLKQAQEMRIIDAAMAYMVEIGYKWEVRFDVISILLHNQRKSPEIKHYIDVFF